MDTIAQRCWHVLPRATCAKSSSMCTSSSAEFTYSCLRRQLSLCHAVVRAGPVDADHARAVELPLAGAHLREPRLRSISVPFNSTLTPLHADLMGPGIPSLLTLARAASGSSPARPLSTPLSRSSCRSSRSPPPSLPPFPLSCHGPSHGTSVERQGGICTRLSSPVQFLQSACVLCPILSIVGMWRVVPLPFVPELVPGFPAPVSAPVPPMPVPLPTRWPAPGNGSARRIRSW